MRACPRSETGPTSQTALISGSALALLLVSLVCLVIAGDAHANPDLRSDEARISGLA